MTIAHKEHTIHRETFVLCGYLSLCFDAGGIRVILECIHRKALSRLKVPGFMNDFDHFIKKTLGIRYYGRYVDDFVIVHQSKSYLKQLIPILSEYLLRELKLTLHPKKRYLQH